MRAHSTPIRAIGSCSDAISSLSSRHRRQWSAARNGDDPSAMAPGRRAQSTQSLLSSPPSICSAADAVPMSMPRKSTSARNPSAGPDARAATVNVEGAGDSVFAMPPRLLRGRGGRCAFRRKSVPAPESPTGGKSHGIGTIAAARALTWIKAAPPIRPRDRGRGNHIRDPKGP